MARSEREPKANHPGQGAEVDPTAPRRPDPAEIARQIVLREGGFSDDPDDPGGATHYGVTLATLRRLGCDLDGDGRTDLRDLRALSPDQAAEIFLQQYFHRPGLSRLPGVLQASLFDMAVNAGPATAVRLLQQLLNAALSDGTAGDPTGINPTGINLAEDGRIGPATLAAAQAAAAVNGGLLADAYGIARRNYYYALADRRPASRKYARRRDGGKGGWIRRAEEFISARFHLSAEEHRERTASWA